MFKEVQAAYDVLSDSEKREQYDSWGSPSGRPEFGPGGSFTFDFGDFGDLGDLLGGIFGGGGGGMRAQPQRGRRGQDVEVELNLSFEDALRGVETTIPVSLESACSTCKGSGRSPGRRPRPARSAAAAVSSRRRRGCSRSRSRARAAAGTAP